MSMSPAKGNILKKIREALSESVPVPFPQSEGNSTVFELPKQENELEFGEQFSKLQGRFVYCADETEMAAQLTELVKVKGWTKLYCNELPLREKLQALGYDNYDATDLASCDAGITTCELLVARTGTIVLSSAPASGRTVSVYAPVHICIAYTSQLVYEVKDGLQQLRDKYAGNLPSLITFASGPSRTADIEKTLVVGVHGPKEVFCFLIEKNA
jgi:L-lactate dehydrogenase complex protein LldG